ncbi:nuclear transport factor 2 family protein [Flavobacterium sp. MAH-1]|uniref:Nuclear transport factor 2 family protein n=1 Tax=Flavobacterium agri TaxID=2743471 RepID=A0A7Y8Y4F0_9FLAO|nr:nuclear transport factor 2 family protein [Flavobacterium agri]NUY82405.1 nuclear transport factor 2 family protein [Flavobacterium agri]NYA72429.1 nuclear transport factor 2 family protein [Flavobacterium agri]
MNKTHLEVVEEADGRLSDAIVNVDVGTLSYFLHPDAIYTTPHGEVFMGAKNLPVNNPKLYRITKLETLERNISFFNSVAVVIAIEKREGSFMDIPFKGLYSTTRMWRFNRHWQLIAATSVII